MRRHSYRWLILCAFFLLGVPEFLAADASSETEAVKAAETWLALVDAGDYERSWTEAATFFKNAVARDQWTKSLDVVRKPLGKLLSRTKAMAKYTRTLPGAPDGEYVVIQFNTSFQNKKSAVETVTPMKDKDGKWRISGYFIK
ncbi:DUF4019 domain-containing protein [Desulfomonile tiedjei]|nr:DUF4019 domain-containing protein [Desulfomonile tiedjei]